MRGRETRAISTVVDVSVFLLLVSAAAFSLVTAGGPVDDTPTTARDEATVESLATATATVRYDLGVDDRTGEPIERVRHGTLAELVAEAALASTSVDGDPLSPHASGFSDAIRTTVSPALDGRTQLVATWRPIRGSRLAGEFRLGPTPPPDATVHAATLTVDSGMPAARDAALAAAPGGYDRVAETVARRTVEGLFPTRRTTVARRGGAADSVVARERFSSMRGAYGSETTLDAGVEPATADLAVTVANHTEPRLRTHFETPEAAASSVRVGHVTVVVRTWS